jgi:hypothetical protein
MTDALEAARRIVAAWQEVERSDGSSWITETRLNAANRTTTEYGLIVARALLAREQAVAELTAEVERLRATLKEGIKIIHCHSRGLHQDWLRRARAELARTP